MASNRTKVLRHQHPLDPSLVKVLSSEERERLRACLPSHVTRDSAEIACDELERAFAIYRSGLANRVSKRPDEINADLDGIEGFMRSELGSEDPWWDDFADLALSRVGAHDPKSVELQSAISSAMSTLEYYKDRSVDVPWMAQQLADAKL
ncbi:hypothetical protein [Magnetospirillum sp. UT-4]|uniref:hypothetical protein n=1 Tax=Magnetospirillum sp. UT-4 TaxID=2681467 RepID=UPI001382C5F3|nr:hypothetical protein [Magnetospirillum sp. UT-4]CAA7618322.1 hypothetical protein MTBUT4_30022 [Magnetospirillum sp. UT-4]